MGCQVGGLGTVRPAATVLPSPVLLFSYTHFYLVIILASVAMTYVHMSCVHGW